MASGHMNRVKRPDTWLHRPMLQNVKKVLANPEPSTHDPERKSAITKIFCLTAAGAFQAPTFDRYTTQVHYASCQRGDRGETDEGPPTDDRQDADGRGTAGRHRRRYGIRDDGFCIRTRNAPGGMDQGRECTPGLSVGRH